MNFNAKMNNLDLDIIEIPDSNNSMEILSPTGLMTSLKLENKILMAKNNEKKDTINRLSLNKENDLKRITELEEEVFKLSKSDLSLKQRIQELENQLAASKSANTLTPSTTELAYAKLTESLKKQLDQLEKEKLKKTTTSLSCIDLPMKLQKLFSMVDSESEENNNFLTISNHANLEDIIEEKINLLLDKIAYQKELIKESSYTTQKLQIKLKGYDKLEEDYERIKKKREMLFHQSDSLKEERNRLTSITEHLKQKTKNLFEQIKTKNSIIQEKDDLIRDLSFELKDLNKDLKKFQKEDRETEESQAKIKKKINKYEQKVSELEAKLNTQMLRYTSDTKKLNEQIQSIQTQNEHKLQEINELNNKSQIENLKQIELLRQQLIKKETQNPQYSKAVPKEVEKMNKELEKKEFVIKTIYEQQKNLELELANEVIAHKMLKAKLAKYDNVIQQVFTAMKNDE